ncbi:hypothetical protein OROGR_030078 [Orobanche gracilis]
MNFTDDEMAKLREILRVLPEPWMQAQRELDDGCSPCHADEFKVKDLPKFVGGTDSEIYLEWERKMESMFELKNLNDERRCKYAILKLEKRVFLWFEVMKKKRTRAGKEKIRSWESLKRKLRKRYVPFGSSSALEIEPTSAPNSVPKASYVPKETSLSKEHCFKCQGFGHYQNVCPNKQVVTLMETFAVRDELLVEEEKERLGDTFKDEEEEKERLSDLFHFNIEDDEEIIIVKDDHDEDIKNEVEKFLVPDVLDEEGGVVFPAAYFTEDCDKNEALVSLFDQVEPTHIDTRIGKFLDVESYFSNGPFYPEENFGPANSFDYYDGTQCYDGPPIYDDKPSVLDFVLTIYDTAAESEPYHNFVSEENYETFFFLEALINKFIPCLTKLDCILLEYLHAIGQSLLNS